MPCFAAKHICKTLFLIYKSVDIKINNSKLNTNEEANVTYKTVIKRTLKEDIT
jgi:hypothetical protein